MAEPAPRPLSWWGWGYADAALGAGERARLAQTLVGVLGVEPPEEREPARLEDLTLPAPRVSAPALLASICDASDAARVTHALGRSFIDVVHGFRGEIAHPPDLVARPGDEAGVAAVLDWCTAEGVAVIPRGGGTSVVGGVEPDVGAGYRGSVSLDLRSLDRLVTVDPVSRAALVEAGTLGPALEAGLRPLNLTLRHFPQSFEMSSVGGWVATRAGGHYATVLTHIDDLVESVRALTPAGVWESRRLPASGAGPSPDRMLAGSEGALGVITRVWLRLQDRPRWRASAGIRFATFEAALEAARGLAQSGLSPAGARVLDPGEALLSGTGDGSTALLVLGLESADHPVEEAARRALEICRDAGGEAPGGLRLRDTQGGERPSGDDAVAGWRGAFLRMPYARDAMVRLGMVSETFETAVTWDRAAALCDSIRLAIRAVPAMRGGVVTTRVTHLYADGCAPYFTVVAPSRHGSQVEQWREIKAAASEAILDGGGTITHHHAVGRDHRPWYDRQRPEPFAAALRAAKRAVDPAWVLNPGVLVDPEAKRGDP